MKKKFARLRQPTAEAQQVLGHLHVLPVEPAEVARFDPLITQHHYLMNANTVGEHVRCVATSQDRWLALATLEHARLAS